jgi:hypothetical protein
MMEGGIFLRIEMDAVQRHLMAVTERHHESLVTVGLRTAQAEITMGCLYAVAQL